jgi:hypothetical protein
MSVHRTTHPRAWGTAAAAAFIAGLSGGASVASAEQVESPPTSTGANATRSTTGTGLTDAIALRPDPANPDRLVVDFGAAGGGAPVAGRSTAFRFDAREVAEGAPEPSGASAEVRVAAVGGHGDTSRTGDHTADPADPVLRDTPSGGGGHGPTVLDEGRDRTRWNPRRRDGAVDTVAAYRRLGPAWV